MIFCYSGFGWQIPPVNCVVCRYSKISGWMDEWLLGLGWWLKDRSDTSFRKSVVAITSLSRLLQHENLVHYMHLLMYTQMPGEVIPVGIPRTSKLKPPQHPAAIPKHGATFDAAFPDTWRVEWFIHMSITLAGFAEKRERIFSAHSLWLRHMLVRELRNCLPRPEIGCIAGFRFIFKDTWSAFHPILLEFLFLTAERSQLVGGRSRGNSNTFHNFQSSQVK